MGVRGGDVLLELNGKRLAWPRALTELVQARRRQEPFALLWLDDLEQRMTSTWTPDPAPADETPSDPDDAGSAPVEDEEATEDDNGGR